MAVGRDGSASTHVERTASAMTTGSGMDAHGLRVLGRLASIQTMEAYSKPEPARRKKRALPMAALRWWAAWAIPGIGMFSEAYIIFSIGLIKPFQKAAFPDCFETHTACSVEETHVMNFIQIGGIIIGMLLFGALGDIIGRAWGSRIVSSIMLVGSTLLVFSGLISNPGVYLRFFIFAQTFYGLGVGGEYPMASASAAERSQSDPALRNKRGQQVVLTFSQQGMGNFINTIVILLLMLMLGQTGKQLEALASRNIIIIQFAVAAAVSVFMTVWRFTRLKESKVWKAEREDAIDITEHVEHKPAGHIYRTALSKFGPRLFATCFGWVANDFAFYGNKLFQSSFIAALYPQATPFERMQWTLLNSAVSLCGYWVAAALVDKKWYGRRIMQTVGFVMMFILFLICGAGYGTLTASVAGYRGFQTLYFLSSFFNQFGPNCTTWLVAAEVFPTDVRSTFQGVSAAWGKVGAIIADVVFGLVDTRMTFFLSAGFGLVGALVTVVFLPDTTGLPLDELDRLHKYMLTGEFEHYHGDAVAPRHLSLFERFALKWDTHHNPDLDAAHRAVQEDAAAAAAAGKDPSAVELMRVDKFADK
ncbi:proton phosphate symporter [Raphidocelis subcapitata]|uniref:Proton phosphate symporter n=1 Tax=Raphidocelis subcapitata TaxID=307507 RepID=A0A2V0PFY9_9CHLO|nr:proton phosphate symporter [Raphidocelis subcapitata]|eukprot:GBF98449.1 proton phosphate symporter [Raphidocelis subcapitata]